jgi:hypothetical protein
VDSSTRFRLFPSYSPGGFQLTALAATLDHLRVRRLILAFQATYRSLTIPSALWSLAIWHIFFELHRPIKSVQTLGIGYTRSRGLMAAKGATGKHTEAKSTLTQVQTDQATSAQKAKDYHDSMHE